MASTIQIVVVLLALVFVHPTISTTTDPPAPTSSTPTPAPTSGTDNVAAPSPLSNLSSPPAPPPSDLSPAPSPSPVNADSPPSLSKSPAPAPNAEVASDISHESESSSEKESSGMNGAKKAGIAIGVIAAVSFVGAGAFVYKKRQQNIQRSQFGFDARREIL